MERWGETPNEKLVNKIANKISWNIWQMDGLRQTVPLGKPYEQFEQLSLFDIPSELSEKEKGKPEAVSSKIYDWRRDNSILFKCLKER